jgi:hypothetical protein
MYRKSSRFNPALILGAVVLVMMFLAGCVTGAPVIIPSPTTEKNYWCFATFEVKAWVDVDENGHWDSGESPLQGVPVHLEFPRYHQVTPGITDSKGAFVTVVEDYPPYDCPKPCSLCQQPKVDATVSVDALANYRQTSQTCDSKGCRVGFAPIPNVYTPTPNR